MCIRDSGYPVLDIGWCNASHPPFIGFLDVYLTQHGCRARPCFYLWGADAILEMLYFCGSTKAHTVQCGMAKPVYLILIGNACTCQMGWENTLSQIVIFGKINPV